MAGEFRSRLFRRCCPSRSSAGGSSSSSGQKTKLPDTPLILAGALGGPFVIFFLTPLRNALTLASQDVESSAGELYASTFHGGFTNGWTGGFAPVLPSCPQFCVMGPLFHFLNEALGSVPIAVVLSAISETLISYSTQTLNAQLAFNREQLQAGTGLEVPLWNVFVPVGPGAVVHITRNIVGMAGIRIFSKPVSAHVRKVLAFVGLRLPEGLQQFLGDLLSSICAAIISAPLNQCYNFAVTSKVYMTLGSWDRMLELKGFLARSYLVTDVAGEVIGVSPTLARDLFMRCAYVATLYALFGAIERLFVALAARWRAMASQSDMTSELVVIADGRQIA